MLSLQLLRTDPEAAKAALSKRGEEGFSAAVDDLLAVDGERRKAIARVEDACRALSAFLSALIIGVFVIVLSDVEKLQERLAKLSGGVAVINVGAATEVGKLIAESCTRFC